MSWKLKREQPGLNNKKAFAFWLVSSITMILVWLTYAAVSNTISSWDTLTASMWNEMAGNYQYNIGEINTGKKWIDGKPIYRRVFDLWDLSWKTNDTNTVQNVAFNNSGDNVDQVTFNQALFSTYVNQPTFYPSSATNQFRYYILKDRIDFRVSTNYSSVLSNVVVVLEYTKTTD